MGKKRFRLSHMIPNAWFYRLRDMKTLSHNLSPSHNHQTTTTTTATAFCYTPKLYSSPSTVNRPAKHVLGSIYIPPTNEYHTHQDFFLSPSSRQSPLFEFNELVQEIDQLQKPPQIVTKAKRDDTSTKENEQGSVSIRENIYKSDKRITKSIVSKQEVSKRDDDNSKFSSGCCIVKATFEPCKDLKESMREMIVDYNIKESKDLEKLLALYLSLNSNEHHDMIIKVFEEIWLTDFLV